MKTYAINFFKSHWDVSAAVGGLLGAITVEKFNAFVAAAIGVATLAFVLCKLAIWALRLRITWLNRNKASFFIKMAGKDEETET